MPTFYEIRVKGHISERRFAWCHDLTVTQSATGDTLLRGWLPDQAALHGILAQIRDMALPLLSIHQCQPGDEPDSPFPDNQ